jgi:hypothetical protein
MRAATLIVVSLGFAGCRYPELPALSLADAQDADSVVDGPVDGAVDAPPDAPHVCYVPASLPSAQLGTVAQPQAGNWFDTPTSGPNANQKEFVAGGQLGSTAPVPAIIVKVARPSGGFVLNQPYAFQTDADPTLPYTAAAALYGDFNTSNGTYKQVLAPMDGSITFTAIGETINSSITGSMTMTHFHEVVEATGAVVPNGCTSAFGGMTFYLTQNQ